MSLQEMGARRYLGNEFAQNIDMKLISLHVRPTEDNALSIPAAFIFTFKGYGNLSFRS